MTNQRSIFAPRNAALPSGINQLRKNHRNPKTLIISANGARSLPENLQKKLEKTADAHYRRILKPMDKESFVTMAYPYEYLAITRRALRQLDRQVIEALPNLKGISVYSTGVEWVDLECLKERDIRFASLPDYCTNAVAETAIGLMFMAAHKLHLRYLKSIKTIPETVSLRGFELKSCTLGVIGYGKIGSLVTEKATHLCSKVLCNDIEESQYGKTSSGVRPASKERILATCDIIIVCASQEFEHAAILAPNAYRLLRPETVVINVGRLSLLNHHLMIDMVKKQRLRSYIYDDLMQANDNPDELEYGKIISSGHTAWYSDEAIKAGTRQWIVNLLQLIDNHE